MELKAYLIMMDLIPALEKGDLPRMGDIIWEFDFRGSKRAEVEHHSFAIYHYMSRLRESGVEGRMFYPDCSKMNIIAIFRGSPVPGFFPGAAGPPARRNRSACMSSESPTISMPLHEKLRSRRVRRM